MQEDRGLDARGAAHPERTAQIRAGGGVGVRGEREQVADVDRQAEERQDRHRQLDQRGVVERASGTGRRAGAVVQGAVQLPSLGPLLRGEPGRAEVDGPGERADDRGEGGRVVPVPAPAQHPQGELRHAVAGAAEPERVDAGRGRDRRLGWRRAPRRARSRRTGAATARGGASGCRSRDRPRRDRRTRPRRPRTRRRGPRGRRRRATRGSRAAPGPAGPSRAGTTPRRASRTGRGSSGTPTGCRRRATDSRPAPCSPLGA